MGARWWLLPVEGQDSGFYRSRLVLRREAGTTRLSGTLWPIASFGSPGGHRLSVGGTELNRPENAGDSALRLHACPP
jgi:hypothetical protein